MNTEQEGGKEGKCKADDMLNLTKPKKKYFNPISVSITKQKRTQYCNYLLMNLVGNKLNNNSNCILNMVGGFWGIT